MTLRAANGSGLSSDVSSTGGLFCLDAATSHIHKVKLDGGKCTGAFQDRFYDDTNCILLN